MLQYLFSIGFVGKYLYENTVSEPVTIALIVTSVVVAIVAGYLLGSINFAIIISARQYRQDIREFGSKNAGMTNMMRTYGKKAAALTLVGDALKAVVACLIGYALIGKYGAYIAGLFCVIGHMFPLYYRFRGGKGVVTAAMMILMCNPLVFAILFLIFVILVLTTKYISFGSVICIMLYPIVLDRIERSTLLYENPPEGSPYAIFAVLIMVLVLVKHRENIKRLLKGTENKFSFKKSEKKATEAVEEIDADSPTK